MKGGKSAVVCSFACGSVLRHRRDAEAAARRDLEDGSIAQVDRTSGTLLRTLQGHSDVVTALDIWPSKSTILSASRDGTCRVWFAGSSHIEYNRHKKNAVYAATFLRCGEHHFCRARWRHSPMEERGWNSADGLIAHTSTVLRFQP